MEGNKDFLSYLFKQNRVKLLEMKIYKCVEALQCGA
jgi:hypothetical protein